MRNNSAGSDRCASPPRLVAPRARACSTRICRMQRAAIPKKWPRFLVPERRTGVEPLVVRTAVRPAPPNLQPATSLLAIARLVLPGMRVETIAAATTPGLDVSGPLIPVGMIGCGIDCRNDQRDR